MKDIINKLQEAINKAYLIYSELVAQILQGQITDVNEIENIMDYLIGYCYDDRFLELYKAVCRHTIVTYPRMVTEHILMFKELYAEETEVTENEQI